MNAQADHEGFLRAALHAAADSLEPGTEGLSRIRARLHHPRPRAVAWLAAAGDALRLRAPAFLQDAYYRLAAEVRAAWDRFAPGPTSGRHRSRTEGWVRPLAAMASVMFIVAAGTYVAINVSTAVSPSSSNSHPRQGQPGPAKHTSHAAPGASPVRSGSGQGSATHRPSPSPSCTPSSQPSSSPTTSPTTSPSPTPTPTVTPSSPGTSPSSPSSDPSPDAVSAVRLTAFTHVASSTHANVAPAPCASNSASAATPAPSADGTVTDVTTASQLSAATLSQPAADSVAQEPAAAGPPRRRSLRS